MTIDIAKFTARFVEEAREHIANINSGLVRLEKLPNDAENLNAIFRSAHTIKGSSRMLKLTAITEVAHRLEDVLGALRERRILHSRELADLLFKGLDVVATMVDQLAGGEQRIALDNTAICEALGLAVEGALQERRPAPGGGGDQPAHPQPEGPQPPAGTRQAPSEPHVAAAETIRVKTGKLDDVIRLMGEVVTHQNKLKQRIRELGVLERAARRQVELLDRGESAGAALEGARSLHAGLKRLLSVIRRDKALQDILTAEFQEKALRMRMVPVSLVFEPLHRMARDLAQSMGKEVDFATEGGEIELDKKMVEKLGDPLVHLLRNALDHGIEDQEQRRQAGKSPRGNVTLSASHEAGGSILIELSDDGAGISTDKIREKALAGKLFDAETLDAMDETALLDLIFLPGFSTSRLITDISGRGVGLDVVRRNIVEDLKGSVTIATGKASGSTFAVRIPMTLAIMRLLLVSVGGRTLGISTRYVTEIRRVPADEIFDVVTRKALRLREEFVPVVDPAALLDNAGPDRGGEQQLLVLIARIGGEKMGFIVDAVLDEEDMVIKPLPDILKSVRLVSGVTVSGKNEIIAILDIPAAMEAAKGAAAVWPGPAAVEHEREINILVVDDSLNTREIERDILEAYGYRVTIAGDGVEALERAGASPFDLVITDVEMPRLNGFALTERLRADPAYREVPIIIVTSREKDEDRRRGIQVGASAYIVKGAFEQSNLVETVQNLIGKGAKP